MFPKLERYITKIERYTAKRNNTRQNRNDTNQYCYRGNAGKGFELKDHRAMHVQRDKYQRCRVVLFNQYSNRMTISERIISRKPKGQQTFRPFNSERPRHRAGPMGEINSHRSFCVQWIFQLWQNLEIQREWKGRGTHNKMSSKKSYQGYKTIPD